MGNLLDIIAIPCDECNGAGFLFYGNDEDYSVMPCDCVDENKDELTLDWNN
jgi:hypothetical protein